MNMVFDLEHVEDIMPIDWNKPKYQQTGSFVFLWRYVYYVLTERTTANSNENDKSPRGP